MRSDLWGEILQLTAEHLLLVLNSMALAIAIGVPLGIYLTRHRAARPWLLGFSNVMQTIPSLALFGFLIPIPFIGGIGKRTVILALVLYALLPILRNTLVGILGVEAAICESAIAMGMTDGQLLRQVQIPLAAPTIMAGIRVATVTTVGTATIAAAIGGGGLGVFIFRGVASVDTAQIFAGAVPAALMALAADWGIGMGRAKIIGALTLVVALIGALALWTVSNRGIRVGSKNFTEQVVLGEIIAQHLENRLQRKVNRQLNLGGTLLAHGALINQEIDVYPEYSGTALTAILKDAPDSDPARVLARVRSAYADRFHVDWLDPLGIDNTFAMVVSGTEARAKHLENLTDASMTGTAWALGVGYEFQQRPDGLAALDRTYHLHWTGSPQTMDLGLLYKALEGKQVTMIAANATDGLLSRMDLKVLADDQHAFPPYQVSIAASQDRLRATPGMREALQELSGKFTNQTMQQLNYQVDGEHRPVSQVAAEFLKEMYGKR